MASLNHWIRNLLTSKKSAFKQWRDWEKERERKREFINSLYAQEKTLRADLASANEKLRQTFLQEDFDAVTQAHRRLNDHMEAYSGFSATGNALIETADGASVSTFLVCLEKLKPYLEEEFNRVRNLEVKLHKSHGLEGEPALTEAAAHLQEAVRKVDELLMGFHGKTEHDYSNAVTDNCDDDVFLRRWFADAKRTLGELIPA
jgi:hypothetical protein